MANTITDLKGFAIEAKKLARNINRAVVAFQRGVTEEVQGAVAEETPVDTGKLRSNWQASVRSPRTDEVNPYFPGRRLGREEKANLTAIKSQGRMSMRGLRVGEDSFITNNVPYVGVTDERGTRTADPGYVDRGIDKGLARATSEREFNIPGE